MSTTDTRAPRQLTAKQLAALRPHVINLKDGGLAARSTAAPKTADAYTSSAADIRAIFEKHLPEFVAAHAPGPVPIVLYAHGGLTDKEAGLQIAEQHVEWWKENGVYPIHFVWETGLWSSVGGALERWATGGRRGWVEEAKDGFLEVAARLLGGPGIWGEMKLDAAAASVAGGGGRLFVEELGRWLRANPNRSTVHAVGHSAGSIFHSHLIPVAIQAGVARFETVTFLAPAVRVDTFAELLLPHTESDRIGRVAVFNMTEQTERDDTCVGLYNKSLLYLVRGAFEPDRGTPILGLEQDLKDSKKVAAFFRRTEGSRGEQVLAPKNDGPRSASSARTHGAFDGDIDTMDSVARRVTGRGAIRSFATVARAREIVLPSSVRDDPAVAGARGAEAGGVRRALTIGIDQYPRAGDRLRGCVADANLWRGALESCGFEVTSLTDADATRERIITGILDLISASKAGDVIAIQYSGHGTTVPDLDGDEEGGEETNDEALCPVDFRDTGQLITDDDLGKLWDVVPEGVGLTLFFDCCHSGDASRELEIDPTLPDDALRRVVVLSKADVAAYRRARGAAAPEAASETARAAFSSLRSLEAPSPQAPRAARTGSEFLFSACRSTEVAWESNGHGDFTRIAAELVVDGAAQGLANRAFHEAVLERFGERRRQTPEWHGTEVLAGRPLLSPAVDVAKDADEPAGGAAVAAQGLAGVPAGGRAEAPRDRRIAAVAAILRATAELLEE